jgi:glucokinase
VSVAIAVDIGGTKLATAVVDERGAILRRRRVPTPDTGDAETLWDAVEDLVREVADGDEEVVVCGVGCGGPMTPDGELVSPLHLPAWREYPLRRRLAELTGSPAFVDNDAKAVALAEGWRGAAAGRSDFLAMVVSTGVGGGLVIDGRLLPGNAGHVGHVIVQPGGRRCRCGGRGCLEAEVSGTAIAERTGRPAEEAGDDVIAECGALVGRAVASVANVLDLRLAVVAGSVALGWGRPFFAAAQAEVDVRARLTFSAGASVVPAGLGHDAPLVGAAAVGWRGMGVPVLMGRHGTQPHPA